MKNNKLKATADYFTTKYGFFKKASDSGIFKDCSYFSEFIEVINGGLLEYKDFLYENDSNPEVIKLYDEGLALIKSSLHLLTGKLSEIDDKIEVII